MEQIDEVKDQKVYYNLQTSGNIKLEPSNDENTTTKDNKCVQFTGNINIATVQFHHIKAEPENKDAKQEISALDCEKDSVPVCGVEETTVKVGPPQEEFVNGISFVAPEGFYGQSEVKQEQINMNDDVLDYVESDPLNVSELNQFIEDVKCSDQSTEGSQNINSSKINQDLVENNPSIHPHDTDQQNNHISDTYYCDMCEKIFINASKLAQHKRYHTTKQSHACDICHKAFVNSYVLKAHKVTHTLHKPFSCDVCTKKFYTSADLTKHRRIHTGAKPYQCDLCDKRFNCLSNLVTHKRTHTGNKPHACESCGKGFTTLNSLKKHQVTHTSERSFECDLCDKTFNCPSNLGRHKRAHTGHRPHACGLCPKTYVYSCDLAKHTRIHTGVRPYVCEVCRKDFISSSNLAKHRRIHTRGGPAPREGCIQPHKDAERARSVVARQPNQHSLAPNHPAANIQRH